MLALLSKPRVGGKDHVARFSPGPATPHSPLCLSPEPHMLSDHIQSYSEEHLNRGTLRTERLPEFSCARLLSLVHRALGISLICRFEFKRFGVSPRFCLFGWFPGLPAMGLLTEHGPSSGSETLDLRHVGQSKFVVNTGPPSDCCSSVLLSSVPESSLVSTSPVIQ